MTTDLSYKQQQEIARTGRLSTRHAATRQPAEPKPIQTTYVAHPRLAALKPLPLQAGINPTEITDHWHAPSPARVQIAMSRRLS